MAQARILTEDWPLVIVEWPAETSTDEVGAHFDEMVALLSRRGGPFAAVVDGTLPSSLDAVLRACTARGLRKVMLATGDRLRAFAYVAPSTTLRGAITAIHWVVPSPVPMQMFDDRDEAAAWAAGFLPVRTTSGVLRRSTADVPADPRVIVPRR